MARTRNLPGGGYPEQKPQRYLKTLREMNTPVAAQKLNKPPQLRGLAVVRSAGLEPTTF